MQYSHSLLKVEGIVARVLRLSRLAKQVDGGLDPKVDRLQVFNSLSQPLTPHDYHAARITLLCVSQREVVAMLACPPPTHKKRAGTRENPGKKRQKMKFNSLSPFQEGGVAQISVEPKFELEL